jgi:hypothetical protein
MLPIQGGMLDLYKLDTYRVSLEFQRLVSLLTGLIKKPN